MERLFKLLPIWFQKIFDIYSDTDISEIVGMNNDQIYSYAYSILENAKYGPRFNEFLIAIKYDFGITSDRIPALVFLIYIISKKRNIRKKLLLEYPQAAIVASEFYNDMLGGPTSSLNSLVKLYTWI